MRFLTSFFFTAVLCIVSINKLFAQTDSIYHQQVLAHTTALYHGSLQKESPVFNGIFYQPYPYRIENKGHSYFFINDISKGTVIYDGIVYANVNIMYNLVRDELILLHFNNVSRIVLNKEKVAGFNLFNHHFIGPKKDTALATLPSDGYHDLLYDGKIKLLAKRIKTITESISSGKLVRTINTSNRYFILKDSVYNQVRNKRNLLKILKQNGNANKQYLRTNGLNFREDRESTILSLVKFYDIKNR